MKIIFLRILRVKGGKALVDNFFLFTHPFPSTAKKPIVSFANFTPIIPDTHILKSISHIKRVYNYNKYNTRAVRINIFYKSIYVYIIIFVVVTYCGEPTNIIYLQKVQRSLQQCTIYDGYATIQKIILKRIILQTYELQSVIHWQYAHNIYLIYS